jgi:hypothetical protein
MTVSSQEMHPGDKVDITMQQLDCYGNINPYPADQYFYIWMNSDEKYGKLQNKVGDEGTWLEGVQPYKFIAASNIDEDTVVVEICAWTWSSGGISTSIGAAVKSVDTLDRSAVSDNNVGKAKTLELSVERLNDKLEVMCEGHSSKRRLQKILEILKDRQVKNKAGVFQTAEVKKDSMAQLRTMLRFQDFMMDNAAGTLQCRPVVHVTVVKEEECIFVEPEKKTLSLGETTILYVKRGDGGVIPADQKFDIELIGPEGDIGALQANGGTPSKKLIGVIPPVTYIAPSSIERSSLTVSFKVQKNNGGVIASVRPPIKALSKDSTKLVLGAKELNSHLYITTESEVTTSGCSVGQVTIFPSCNDQTSYEYLIPIVVNDPSDIQGGGGCLPVPLKIEPPSAPQPPEYFIDPEVCFNEPQNCVRLMIPYVYAYIPLRIGTCPPTAIQIETKDNIYSIEIAKFVIQEFNNQIKRIDEIIALLKKNRLPLPNGSKIQNFEKLWSRTAIYVHEREHATWFFSVIKDAINEVKPQLPKCRPWDEVKDMTIDQMKDSFNPPAWKIIANFTDTWGRIMYEQTNKTEEDAHRVQKKFLEELIKSIEKKFGLELKK